MKTNTVNCILTTQEFLRVKFLQYSEYLPYFKVKTFYSGSAKSTFSNSIH